MIVKITDDFDLYKITNSGQCFRANALNNGWYRFIFRENILYIKQIGSADYEVSCDEATWKKVWVDYFDLRTDYTSLRATIDEGDTYMLSAAATGTGIRILNQDPWEMVVSFIISQRRSIPAIRSAVEKIAKLYGEKITVEAPVDSIGGTGNCETIYTFPSPSQMKNAAYEELASCGIGYRVPYILDAIERVNYGDIDLEFLFNLDDDELFESLKSIKGIGDKVANCIMLFAYHRLRRAPVDTWIAKIIDAHYDGVNPFPKYSDNAGLMQQYVFYAAQHVGED